MRSPLVGRTVERAGLEAALARCRGGGGGVLLVSGEAGVGKSRLVSDALADWDGLILRGSVAVGDSAYAPVVQVLRGVSEAFGEGALGDDVKVLLPELSLPWREVDHGSVVDAIQRTLRGVARQRPTVVVLEDLHWATAATIDLLPALASSLVGESLLVLCSYRSDELPRTHAVRSMRNELRRAGLLAELVLAPLTEGETGQLLASGLGRDPTPELVSAVHDRAEGLPFFVEELAAALSESGGLREHDGGVDLAPDTVLPLPESVLDAVLVRTARLRRNHPEAVELAAVLGVRVDLPVLADLVPPPDIDHLLDDGLLREQTAESAVFRHALVRDALYRAIPWARRRGHHRLVAERLTARCSEPEVIAEHWVAAHEQKRARPLLLAAAQRFCSVHAYRDAAALGRRALAIWPEGTDPDGRIAALEGLADCAELCGELDSAAATWQEIAGLRHANADGDREGAAYRRLANAAGMLGDIPRATTAREAAAEAFAAAGLHAEAALERLTLAEHLKNAAHLSRALDHAVAASVDAEAAERTDLRARALTLEGTIRAALGEGARGVDLARCGLELALAGQMTETATLNYYEFAEALLYSADYAASADAYGSARELCRSHSDAELEQACFACMSVAVRFLGEWDRSLAICAEVLGDERTPEEVRMVAHEESGLITVLRGDRRRARGPLRRAATFGRSHEVFGIEIGAIWGLAVAADLDGDRLSAVQTISTLLERCQAKEDWNFALPALRWSATYLAVRGERDGLAHCHRLLATAATRNSAPKVLSALAHAGAELALADGDAALSSAQFGRAVELLHGVTVPFELALTQLRRGVALSAEGEREAAVETVSSAYRTARHLGAKPLARSCAAELADMGEQVDRRLGRLAARSLEPTGLTRREKEVLRLLARGQTNRQIAAELFLSPRTVDMHVRNLLGKLGCASRVAAARRAAELGLVETSGHP